MTSALTNTDKALYGCPATGHCLKFSLQIVVLAVEVSIDSEWCVLIMPEYLPRMWRMMV